MNRLTRIPLRRIASLTGASVMAWTLHTRWAGACVDGAMPGDTAITEKFGCTQEFTDIAYNTFKLRKFDRAGLESPCDDAFPFRKTVNAVRLLFFGLPLSSTRGGSQQFHGAGDYISLAASVSPYHKPLEYRLDWSSSPDFASYSDDTITLGCVLFDKVTKPIGAFSDPSVRVGDFMHEAWHAWNEKREFKEGACSGHDCGGCVDGSCDPWYPHGITRYGFGHLHVSSETESPPLQHLSNQVQAEYLCDLGLYAEPWVPWGIQLTALDHANFRFQRRLIGASAVTCGAPRMFNPRVTQTIRGTVRFPSQGTAPPRVTKQACNRVIVRVGPYTEPAMTTTLGDLAVPSYGAPTQVTRATGVWNAASRTCSYQVDNVPAGASRVWIGADYRLVKSPPIQATWNGGDSTWTRIRSPLTVVATPSQLPPIVQTVDLVMRGE